MILAASKYTGDDEEEARVKNRALVGSLLIVMDVTVSFHFFFFRLSYCNNGYYVIRINLLFAFRSFFLLLVYGGKCVGYIVGIQIVAGPCDSRKGE